MFEKISAKELTNIQYNRDEDRDRIKFDFRGHTMTMSRRLNGFTPIITIIAEDAEGTAFVAYRGEAIDVYRDFWVRVEDAYRSREAVARDAAWDNFYTTLAQPAAEQGE